MKEYKCIKDYYIEDIKIASKNDILKVLPDNNTVVNITTDGKQRAFTGIADHLDNGEYFRLIFRTKKENQSSSVNKDNEKVNHPSHYTWLKERCGIEVIDITRHLDFCTGNAIKYLLRAGYKEEEGYTKEEKTIEDLKKAIFYIEDRIKSLQKDNEVNKFIKITTTIV